MIENNSWAFKDTSQDEVAKKLERGDPDSLRSAWRKNFRALGIGDDEQEAISIGGGGHPTPENCHTLAFRMAHDSVGSRQILEEGEQVRAFFFDNSKLWSRHSRKPAGLAHVSVYDSRIDDAKDAHSSFTDEAGVEHHTYPDHPVFSYEKGKMSFAPATRWYTPKKTV